MLAKIRSPPEIIGALNRSLVCLRHPPVIVANGWPWVVNSPKACERCPRQQVTVLARHGGAAGAEQRVEQPNLLEYDSPKGHVCAMQSTRTEKRFRLECVGHRFIFYRYPRSARVMENHPTAGETHARVSEYSRPLLQIGLLGIAIVVRKHDNGCAAFLGSRDFAHATDQASSRGHTASCNGRVAEPQRQLGSYRPMKHCRRLPTPRVDRTQANTGAQVLVATSPLGCACKLSMRLRTAPTVLVERPIEANSV